MRRHQEACQYLRLMWKPKRGDRVVYDGKRTTVDKVAKGKGIRLSHRHGYLLPGQVRWRPKPSDFNAVLTKLQDLWVYRELLDGNRQLVGVRVNGRIVHLRGRPQQILSRVLSLRTLNPEISIHINRLFESAYTVKGIENVRIHAITAPESRDPS